MDTLEKIKITSLTYAYPMATQNALEDITFSINSGEFIGIIGRNGSGKSTLCFAIAGLIPRFFKGKLNGNIYIDGEDVTKMPLNKLIKKVGLVLQNPFSQISGAKMTVYEEIAFGLENIGTPREEMVEKVEQVLKKFGLWDKKNNNPFELSGGQLQRLAIASILALEPEILILDEPTSQLDPQGADEVFQVVKELRKTGITIIMVEHKFEKLVEYAEKIILLHEGKLIAFEEPEKVFSMPEIDEYQIGEPIQTAICKKLNIRNAKGYYPVKLNEAVELMKGVI
ncbi:MAG: energy-coupling factor ABC transporter ATP-binding protein [Candidatus Kryptonium sp.]|nr:energy-coupling factor ABC transporter ATP-binding protein [Candidatus Kryptonium sp.]